MDNILNIVFIITFLGMLIISAIVLLDINFEKIFKKGKIGSIRAFFFIVIFLVSIFTAWGFRELVSVIYNILKTLLPQAYQRYRCLRAPSESAPKMQLRAYRNAYKRRLARHAPSLRHGQYAYQDLALNGDSRHAHIHLDRVYL